MARRLPGDVAKFLLDNPKEVERIQSIIRYREDEAKRQAEHNEKRKNAKTVPCGTYGCTYPRNELDTMCKKCYADYLTDPDAYK